MSSKHYVCDPASHLEPIIGTSGPSAWKATTVPTVFKATAVKFPKERAMALKRRANVSNIPNNCCRRSFLFNLNSLTLANHFPFLFRQ